MMFHRERSAYRLTGYAWEKLAQEGWKPAKGIEPCASCGSGCTSRDPEGHPRHVRCYKKAGAHEVILAPPGDAAAFTPRLTNAVPAAPSPPTTPDVEETPQAIPIPTAVVAGAPSESAVLTGTVAAPAPPPWDEMDDRPRAAREREAAPVASAVATAPPVVTAPVRIAIVGSRDFARLDLVRKRVSELPAGSVVVTGGALGVDKAAEQAARDAGLKVHLELPTSDNVFALLARNSRIAENCTSLVAFHAPCKKCKPGTCKKGGWSHGTADAIEKARKKGKPVEVVYGEALAEKPGMVVTGETGVKLVTQDFLTGETKTEPLARTKAVIEAMRAHGVTEEQVHAWTEEAIEAVVSSAASGDLWKDAPRAHGEVAQQEVPRARRNSLQPVPSGEALVSELRPAAQGSADAQAPKEPDPSSQAGAEVRASVGASTGEPKPNEGQARALEALKAGRNVFLNGIAGTGKTWALNAWFEWCRSTGYRVAVTATTGIAALNLSGKTLHSWLGLRPGQTDPVKVAADERWQRTSRWGIRRAQAICIEEISMCDARLLDMAEALCRLARDDEGGNPWGGLQVALVGDFGQLPPVELDANGWAFQSSAWAIAGLEDIELTQVVRQREEQFIRVLQEIRLGVLSPEGKAVLGARVRAFNPDDPDMPATRIVTHNNQKDAINARKLAELPGDAMSFKANDWSNGDKSGEFALSQIQKNCLSPAELILKKNARVMFTRNSTKKEATGYVNGSTGTVIALTPSSIKVRLDRGGVVDCQMAAWTIDRDERPLASRTQYPLVAGYAVTAHRSQGQTLDRVSVDLVRTFCAGQAYVALSRCRTLQGLNIEDWREQQSVFAHPAMLAWSTRDKAPVVDGGW